MVYMYNVQLPLVSNAASKFEGVKRCLISSAYQKYVHVHVHVHVRYLSIGTWQDTMIVSIPTALEVLFPLIHYFFKGGLILFKGCFWEASLFCCSLWCM